MLAKIDVNFIELLTSYDVEAKHKLLANVTLDLIDKAIVAPDTILGSCILCPLTCENQNFSVMIDMNTFDMAEPHGRDERLYPNDPWLTAHLYRQLTDVEKETLRHRIENLDKDQTKINARVTLILNLIEEIAEGMAQRYFGSNLQGRDALPTKLSNDPLIDVIQKEEHETINSSSLILQTAQECSFLPSFPPPNLPQLMELPKTLKSSQKIAKHRKTFNHALNAATTKNNTLCCTLRD